MASLEGHKDESSRMEYMEKVEANQQCARNLDINDSWQKRVMYVDHDNISRAVEQDGWKIQVYCEKLKNVMGMDVEIVRGENGGANCSADVKRQDEEQEKTPRVTVQNGDSQVINDLRTQLKAINELRGKGKRCHDGKTVKEYGETMGKIKQLEEVICSLKTQLKSQQQRQEDMLSCSNCNIEKKNVVLTKCFHVFCMTCITKRYETRDRRCPKCNVRFGANDYHPFTLF